MKLKSIVLAVVSLFVGGLFLGAQTKADNIASLPDSNSDSRLISAVQAIEYGQYKYAETTLADILKNDRDYDAAWYYLGLAQAYQGDYGNARQSLKMAIAIDPGNYWYKDRLATIYTLQEEDELAMATLEGMIKDFPDKTDAYFDLVNLYMKHNQLDKALESMDNIEASMGKNEQTVLTRYDILIRQERPEDAAKLLEEFNKEYSSTSVSSLLGELAINRYEDSLALGYFQEALALDHSYSPALMGVAEVYRMRRNWKDFFPVVETLVSDAEVTPEDKTHYLGNLVQRSDPRFLQNFRPQLDSVFAHTLVVHPSDSSILQTATLYYFYTDRKPVACELMAKSAATYPESIGIAASYVDVLAYSNDWQGLYDASGAAFERFRNVGFLDYQNTACYNLKNYQGIVDNCETVIRMFPKDTSKTIPAYTAMGDAYHSMDNHKNAYKAYEKVLKLRPDYNPVLNNYAYYLSLEGKNLKKAYEMSKKTVETEPDNATYLDTFGWILYLRGNYTEAKAVFKHCMLYGGKESAVILRHYAKVLEALGEDDLAKVYYDKARVKDSGADE